MNKIFGVDLIKLFIDNREQKIYQYFNRHYYHMEVVS